MTDQQWAELYHRIDAASEEARIESIENELRLRHNTFAPTADLVPYRCDAHVALVGAMGDLFTAMRED